MTPRLWEDVSELQKQAKSWDNVIFSALGPPRKSWGTYFHVKLKNNWGPLSSLFSILAIKMHFWLFSPWLRDGHWPSGHGSHLGAIFLTKELIVDSCVERVLIPLIFSQYSSTKLADALHELWVSLMGSKLIVTVLNVLVGRAGILQSLYCLNNPIKDAHREPL